eukprot:IDg5278t1
MSVSDIDIDSMSTIKIPRFLGRRGDDYGLWRLRLRAICRVKGLWGVFEADARCASNRTVSKISVQKQLLRIQYTDRSMASYVDKYASLFSQLGHMGKDAAIPDLHKAPMLLASINLDCVLESTAAALRTNYSAELTWDYVATTLIDEYNARQIPMTDSSRRTRNRNRRSSKNTARALAVALKGAQNDVPENRRSVQCYFCGKWATLKSDVTSTQITRTTVYLKRPPNDRRSYADSRATVHCFYNELTLIAGSLKPCTP